LVKTDGSLDIWALQETLHDLRDVVDETRSDVKLLNGRLHAVEGWRRSVEKAADFSAGVIAGRGKLLGFVDRGLVLLVGLGGVAVALLK